MNKPAAPAMAYTYTVRSMEVRTYTPFEEGFSLTNAGAVLTIRKDNKVVKQWPRFSTETKAHRAARLWFFMKGLVK